MSRNNQDTPPTSTQKPVDLEKTAREGRRPPKGRRYRIRIDSKKYLAPEATMTGREILELAERTPADDYVLILRIWGECNEVIELDKEVDLTRRGIERFVTGREDDDIVVTVFAPRSPRPKHFTWDADLLVSTAAQEAAKAFDYDAGSPGLQEGERILDGDKSLEDTGVEQGDELELFDTGGGV